MVRQINIAFGIPAYGGQICAGQSRMWLSVGAALVERSETMREVMFGYVDINGVQRARNRLLAEAMRANADWLVMIDADTWIEAKPTLVGRGSANDTTTPGRALLRMIDEAHEMGLAIASAPYRVRAIDPDRNALAAYRRPNPDDPATTRQLFVGEIPFGWLPVDEVGAGCIAIHLHSVLAANADFQFTDQLSEDRYFCRQMRARGFRIALDGRIRTGHLSRSVPLYSE